MGWTSPNWEWEWVQTEPESQIFWGFNAVAHSLRLYCMYLDT